MITREFRRAVEQALGLRGWTNWTPTVTQLGSVAVTINNARYMRIGKLIILTAYLTVTGSGTGNNAIVISGLPATGAYATAGQVVGDGAILDNGSAWYAGASLIMETTTTLKFRVSGNNDYAGITPNFALANTDAISFTCTYEAA